MATVIILDTMVMSLLSTGEPEPLATEAGVYRPDIKAGDLVAWLKAEYELGHGHSMAIWAVFKDKGWVQSSRG